MTKDQAFRYAEKFLLKNYEVVSPEYCGIAVTKCAEKDAAWVCRALEAFIEFEKEIIQVLKEK